MSTLKITLAQINPTIGDIRGNIELMRGAALKAQGDGSQMVIFPELSLTGYSPRDLLDEAQFITRTEAGLAELIQATLQTPGMHWVVGAPVRHAGPGKHLQNCLLVLADGKVVMKYAKQLLPTYNVFDEHRYFEPGPDTASMLQVGGKKVGFLICEDGWNDEGLDYAVNPFVKLSAAAPDLVVSINASPSNIGKREQRHALFTAASRRHRLPMIYVNQVGGNDQLVFDGASFAVTPEHGVVFEAERFVESVTTLQLTDGDFRDDLGSLLTAAPARDLPVMEFYRRQIMLGLRDYARRCGFTQVVVGCSGGIDSALTVTLAAETMGAQNVVAITMPSRFSSTGSVGDSEILCRNLGVKLYVHPIRELVERYEQGFAAAFGTPLQGLALENLQARVRGTVLMEYSNSFGHLLLTTGNKSEISVGYCTLYGDTNGGLGLIGDLYKTEVFDLCRHINAASGRELIPAAIIDKLPSAELAPGQFDTDSLPPYPVLDTILRVLIEGDRLGTDEKEIVKAEFSALSSNAEGRALIERVKRMIDRNEYKRRQAPPILRLRGRAFGIGRQMPIAAKYE
ncbi:MAG TPA: NAD+ synthase [Sideroxyarcus sp.]|nr:NAD+ synthase [Sideroxyarcus sp.]